MQIFSSLKPNVYLRFHIPRLKNSFRNFKRSLRTKTRNGTFGPDVNPEFVLETPRENRMFPGLIKSLFFAVGFSSCAFVSAIIWKYEIKKENVSMPYYDWLNTKWDDFHGWEKKTGDLRKSLNQYWNNISDNKKAFWCICGANLLVFLAWRHPAMQQTLSRFFCLSPAAQAVCWPMSLSTFSHITLFHVSVNMFALYNFCEIMSNVEQFLAFYLSSGVISSFASSLHKVAKGTMRPSLGASGAIMALIGYFCSKNPDALLKIIFIPGITFTASSGLLGIMCFDAAGILFGFKLLDHAGHLGGVLFGVFYAYYGQNFIYKNKRHIIEYWEKLIHKIK